MANIADFVKRNWRGILVGTVAALPVGAAAGYAAARLSSDPSYVEPDVLVMEKNGSFTASSPDRSFLYEVEFTGYEFGFKGQFRVVRDNGKSIDFVSQRGDCLQMGDQFFEIADVLPQAMAIVEVQTPDSCNHIVNPYDLAAKLK